MNKRINNIVIVGGGTAGWLVASRLSAKHQASPDSNITITLVESPTLKPVGVGEGTWPTMRTTLKSMGISEAEFIVECDATFKQGSKFNGWVNGHKDDQYYHPFSPPAGYPKQNHLPYWQSFRDEASFSNMFCPQEFVCEKGLAPKLISTAEYAPVTNYAYHLNAGKFSAMLKRHCMKKYSVQHVLDDVVRVNAAEDGDISSVTTKLNGDISGDLFVDCSGFNSLLLGGHYNVPFIEKLDTLFVDSALAVQIPYENEDSPIACVTESTATSAGWIWDIGLTNRKGIGHVYSSRHTTEEKAAAELESYLGKEVMTRAEVNKIPIKPGHRHHPWEKNCVAIGLSAGFLEPLEASAIVQVELSADWLCDQLPETRETMDIVSKRFNAEVTYRWSRIIDFLKLHYVLSQRTDNDFWIDNRDPASIPESLQESLELWKYHYPWTHDFTHSNEIFCAASYQYILSGMGFHTNSSHTPTREEQIQARENISNNRRTAENFAHYLPKHRDLLNKIKQHNTRKTPDCESS